MSELPPCGRELLRDGERCGCDGALIMRGGTVTLNRVHHFETVLGVGRICSEFTFYVARGFSLGVSVYAPKSKGPSRGP